MSSIDASTNIGSALVYTSTNKGHTPEQIAEMALGKMMVVAEDANPLIRDQAIEYQENQSYRTTFEAGSPALGGTRERMHRDLVEIESNQAMSQQIAHSDHADNLVRGTRG